MSLMLEKTTRLNMLYDFYHSLLTKKQMEYMELYYREDYSLAEIANHNDVSRQAVHDTIRRTEQHLEMYEKKLQLYFKFNERKKLLTRLDTKLQQAENVDKERLFNIVEQLRNIE